MPLDRLSACRRKLRRGRKRCRRGRLPLQVGVVVQDVLLGDALGQQAQHQLINDNKECR